MLKFFSALPEGVAKRTTFYFSDKEPLVIEDDPTNGMVHRVQTNGDTLQIIWWDYKKYHATYVAIKQKNKDFADNLRLKAAQGCEDSKDLLDCYYNFNHRYRTPVTQDFYTSCTSQEEVTLISAKQEVL